MSAVSPEAKARKRAYDLLYFARRKRDPEFIRRRSEAAARWIKNNPDKAREVHNKSMRRYRATDAGRESCRKAGRKIAGLPIPTRPCPAFCEVIGCNRKAICLDHEHLTSTFRGWLCHPCNRAASKNHTPDLLRALADYVERHS